MYTYFKTETDAAQNLIDNCFSNLGCQKTFHRKDFKWKKYGGYWVSFWKKTEALHAELNEKAEAATSSYSAEVDFLQYIYSVFVAKNR